MANMQTEVTLTRSQVRRLSNLIGRYQGLLESAIDCELIPGTAEPMKGSRRQVERDRQHWRDAEDLQKFLTSPRRKAATS